MSEDTATKEPEAQLPDDTTPVPIGTAPASSADSELDELLKQFDEATNKPAEAEPVADNATEQVSRNELDNFLAGLDSERNRISELEGEISSLRAAELDRQSRADFEGFSKKLQASLGPNVDDQFARTNLLAALAERPELATVWQHRHVTDEQLRAADQEFKQLEAIYHRAIAAPDDPRKQQAVAALWQRGYQLGPDAEQSQNPKSGLAGRGEESPQGVTRRGCYRNRRSRCGSVCGARSAYRGYSIASSGVGSFIREGFSRTGLERIRL